MGKKSKTSCGIEQTFTLPDPIITSDIRIYPQKWSGKPFIRINFFTCTLEGKFIWTFIPRLIHSV